MLWRTLQVTGFQLYLKYNELPHPRCGDVVVMEFAMSMGLDKEDLMSMSRVKGRLGVIFLSDMTTADGKHLEYFTCYPSEQALPQTKFTLSRDAPTDHDWEVWRNFWCQHTVENFQLHTPLGAWTPTPHRRWILFHDEETNCLKKRNGLNTDFYFPVGNEKKNKIWDAVRQSQSEVRT